MTISQHRMISLINSANDYRRALERLTSHLSTLYQAYQSNHLTAEQFASHTVSYLNPIALLDNPTESPAIIAVEHAHFQRNAKSNDRRAAKAATKRSLLPITSRRSTTPRTTHLNPAPNLPTTLTKPTITFQGLSPSIRAQIDAEVTLINAQSSLEAQDASDDALDAAFTAALTKGD